MEWEVEPPLKKFVPDNANLSPNEGMSREKNTRGRLALDSKCWVMVIVCPTTRLINMQVVETSRWRQMGLCQGISGCVVR